MACIERAERDERNGKMSSLKLRVKSICFALLMLTGLYSDRASALDLVMYGNTAQTGSVEISAFNNAAQSFTTNQLIYRLTGVSITLNQFRGSTTTNLAIDLYDSGSTPNTPGSLVLSLGNLTTPTVNQDFTFTYNAPSPVLLAQDSQYFIVVRNLGPDSVKWWTGDQSSISTVLTPRPTFYSVTGGLTWDTPTTTRSFNMSVTGVPEPSTYAFAALSVIVFAVVSRSKSKVRLQATA